MQVVLWNSLNKSFWIAEFANEKYYRLGLCDLRNFSDDLSELVSLHMHWNCYSTLNIKTGYELLKPDMGDVMDITTAEHVQISDDPLIRKSISFAS